MTLSKTCHRNDSTTLRDQDVACDGLLVELRGVANGVHRCIYNKCLDEGTGGDLTGSPSASLDPGAVGGILMPGTEGASRPSSSRRRSHSRPRYSEDIAVVEYDDRQDFPVRFQEGDECRGLAH